MAGPKGTSYVYGVACVASVGGLLGGYDLAIMDAAHPLLQQRFNLSPSGLRFTIASAVLGCVAGSFLGGWLCDWLGRRRALIASALLLGVGAAITALPNGITTFNVFRIVGGLGVGICSVAAPLYIVEVAAPRNRGALGFLFPLAIVTGWVLSIVAANVLGRLLPDATSWRWLFASQWVLIVAFLVGLTLIPETPRWLAARGRHREAYDVVQRIGGPDYAGEQMREIVNALAQESGTWGALLAPGIRRALLVGLLLALFQNYTGWAGIYGFLPTLVQQAGFAERWEVTLQYVLAYSFLGLMTLVACFVVDHVGRRRLWIGASALLVTANLLIGYLFQANVTGIPVLLAVCLLATPHALALGPLPWLMISELYPNRIRARAVSISTTVLWSTAFFPALLFPLLQGWSQRQFGSVIGVFALNAAVCVLSFFFGWLLLPETRGRSLESIAESWRGTPPDVAVSLSTQWPLEEQT